MKKSTAKVNVPKKTLPLHKHIATGGKPSTYKGSKAAK